MNTSPNDDYDFGFSFADDETIQLNAPQKIIENNNEDIVELKQKLDALLNAQEQTMSNVMILAIEEKYKAKLKEVESLILPLLLNLKKNPEKAYINWPNRASIIDKQIEKITKITRSE